jgi:hypothetical protein
VWGGELWEVGWKWGKELTLLITVSV